MSADKTLLDTIRTRARAHPDAALLVGGGSSRTWSGFDVRSNRAARLVRDLGLRRGDRAAILAGNRIEWIEAFVAVLKAGAVAVPVNERLTAAERGRLLEDAGVSLLIGEAGLLAETPFSGPTLALDVDYAQQLAGCSGGPLDLRPDPADLAVIAYTSGTTGMPKGAMWSHGGLCWSAQFNPFPAALARGARVLLCAPLYAGGAIVMACNVIAVGGTLVIARFAPEAILKTLADDGIELVGLVPTMISMLADAAPPGWQALKLRRIYYGGGGMSRQLLSRARKVFGCEFQQCYGMTETCIAGTRLDPVDHLSLSLERIGSAGKPMPGVDVRVVDERGAEVPVGTLGEICIRSPGNMLGYWRRDEQNRHARHDGWYRTRDIGRFDGDGYLYLVDRKDDMVKSGGFNVAPAEVEAVLVTHPGVEEAAVIGVPDERWGERVAAVVRTRDGAVLQEGQLAGFCRRQLADYKTPRVIIFTGAPLPRTALGKISRRAVRMQYAGSAA